MPVAGQLLPDDSAEGTDGLDFPPVTCQAEQAKDLFCCEARADARALSNMKERLCWVGGGGVYVCVVGCVLWVLVFGVLFCCLVGFGVGFLVFFVVGWFWVFCC